ncbi:similar to short-chain dehydrogenase/reductase SDR [Plenodomus lingam JN3]|uniref:Similar to short-chain dehydrogenase/reductase SDR n=1 Tax=Leptosphaeria maculans (strain JN3 / isolate v23.1.3 / race Av1-4-5-6-7-8) TaxID=985895 RepID=E5AB63_LEPMJ|nr:similar to short-chain dehydrogenase/reductase SDR [Plenodomus lingam JN3]CBY00904.1 similar to short-chain dehydrogenase/reductase SDR [Plenodomus lingam JN3]
MSKSFQDKIVLITGGGSGIGRATALKMASMGASISLCDINVPNLEAVASQCCTPTHAQQVDVGCTAEVQSFVDTTLARFSKIDYVFNCAGVNPTSIPLEETTDAYWDKLVNTNLKGCFLVTRAVLPHLQRGAAIVNVSSISGMRGSAMQSVYCTTKFGLIGMTKSLALELGPRGIRVNCVAPGYIDTPSNAGIVKGGEFVERMRMGNALERLGTPDEVADVVAVLFGEESRYVNGAVMEIDGGLRG